MASAGARAYNGGPEAPSPRSRGHGAKPPGAERLLASGHPMEAANLPYSLKALRIQMLTGTL